MAEVTRDHILKIIRTNGKASVNELAEGAGISPISVRHHLASLAADQLIKAEDDRQGIGRPRKLYSLTELALEQTPGRYLRLTHRILDRMKNSLTPVELKSLFKDIADSMADEIQPRIAGLPTDRKLKILADYLTEEGFAVELEHRAGEIILHELACPYFRISREHPEVCSISRTLISRTLGVPARREHWLMDGDAHCSFKLSLIEKPVPAGIEESPAGENQSDPQESNLPSGNSEQKA